MASRCLRRDTSTISTALASRCQGSALLTQPAAEASIAPTGNLVVFTTASRGCSPQADPDFGQVYSRLLGLIIAGTEPTQWISRPSGTGAFMSNTNDSAIHGLFRSEDTNGALSSDGSVAAFVSEANELSPFDNDTFTNVFARDNRTGVTELISRASGADGAAGDLPSGPALHRGVSGVVGAGPAAPPAISADGRYVAFTSAADNLVPNDTNGHMDVFVRDRVAQTTTLVSVKSDGTQVNADSGDADISADGNRVAFASKGRLDPSVDLSPNVSVYVRDLAAGTTTLASRQSGANADANSNAASPSISGDGNRVAFLTDATNLAPSLIDNNGVSDVYVHDLADGTTLLASTRNGQATAGDHGALAADIDFTVRMWRSPRRRPTSSASATPTARATCSSTRSARRTPCSSAAGPGGAAGNGRLGRAIDFGRRQPDRVHDAASDLIPGRRRRDQSMLVRDVAARHDHAGVPRRRR